MGGGVNMSTIENKDVMDAIDRIARTQDGQLFYRYLQKTLCTVPLPDIHDGALRQFEGRRMFASELMGLMAAGIADSDRYALTFVRSAEPRQPATRGAARRITPDTVVPGWNDPAFGGPGTGDTGNAGGPTTGGTA